MVVVLVHGYGTVGRRVADAVHCQEDMEIKAVIARTPSYRTKTQRYPIVFQKDVDFEAISKGADVIVTCLPKGATEEYLDAYGATGVPVIYQGGEPSGRASVSFNARVNFPDARSRRAVRVVSCGTTGLCRVLFPLKERFGIVNAYAVLIRRSVDPNDSVKGPINAIIPDIPLPSHHGDDVQSVFSVPLVTAAVKVPTTLMHLHVVSVTLRSEVEREDVVSLFEEEGRLRLISTKDGFRSTAQVMDYARELNRTRSDFYENAIWRDSISVRDGVLYFMQGIHQEAITVPETVDAIRAVCTNMEMEESVRRTDEALEVGKERCF